MQVNTNLIFVEYVTQINMKSSSQKCIRFLFFKTILRTQNIKCVNIVIDFFKYPTAILSCIGFKYS